MRVEYGDDLEGIRSVPRGMGREFAEFGGQTIVPAIGPQNASLRLELSGDKFRVELSRQDDRLITMINDQSNCTHLPPPSDYLLMREELTRVGHDPIFEKALAAAAKLAGSQ